MGRPSSLDHLIIEEPDSDPQQPLPPELEAAWWRLTTQQRDALRLRTVHDLTYREVAEVMCIKPAAALKLMADAYAALRMAARDLDDDLCVHFVRH